MSIEESKYYNQTDDENVEIGENAAYSSSEENEGEENNCEDEMECEGECDGECRNEDEIFYFKYEFEGSKEIDDILCNLERLKHIFENYKNNGYKLREDVNSGYCFLYKEE